MVGVMPEDQAARVTVVSLNTRGVPVTGSRLAARYAVIGESVDAGDADAACFQEVFSWLHLRLLTRAMRSFRHVSFRPSLAGPAGGLVTFSRLPVSGTAYRAFGMPPRSPGVSRTARLRAALKGTLVTQLAHPGVCIVNTHPVANRDGDWSPAGRFYPLHRAQLDVLARVVRGVRFPPVVCGDFNIDRGSPLFGEFTAAAGLADAFEGNCPATFRAEYLPAGATPHCIDFILAGGGVKAEAAAVLLDETVPLPGGPGHVSDHVGLRASLLLALP
jgi:endonuclease/exonuclease/phosphatase family metal-dependent hydrolase